jgi:ubiquinone/menaquinone biosynthesis C-methylase UbiE
MQDDSHEGIQEERVQSVVREAYAEHAAQVWHVAETIYRAEELASLPVGAVTSSLGLDHPIRAAHLQSDEVVLDLGCGGGIDTRLSELGLDVTHEMLVLAQANATAMGVTNTRFLEGMMEEIPLPDAAVDVVISNGVFNLAADKDRVFAEARLVLQPAGPGVLPVWIASRAVILCTKYMYCPTM